MRAYTLSHLGDHQLLRDLAALVTQDRTTTAALLAHLAEVDARRLYLPAAYPSMYAYCVHQLRLSEDAAYKRIQAARVARQFPAIFTALAEGRLHLSAVVLLAPYLTRENVEELLGAAALKTKSEIEQWLARRFPRSEMLAMVQALPASAPRPDGRLAPGQVEARPPGPVGALTDPLAPGQVEVAAPRSKVEPHAPERFALHLTMSQATYDKLQHAQALLGHAMPAGDIAAVLDRALDALIARLEQRKLAATDRPRTTQRRSAVGTRTIPAHVKRAVWERDRGQCAFVSAAGQRCPARKFLEYGHLDPVARGGRATVAGIRLECRAHNQYQAECVFGAGFMSDKRAEARRAAAAARARAAEAHAPVAEAGAQAVAAEAEAHARATEAEAHARATEAEAQARAAAEEQAKDVMAGLRELGFRAAEARRAAEFCETIPVATLEERMRAALKFLGPKRRLQSWSELAAIGDAGQRRPIAGHQGLAVAPAR